MGDGFFSEPDYKMGKILKYLKPNPVGEDVYLDPDGVTIHRDEDKIILAQRIFKHNYYRADGPWELKTRGKYASGASTSETSTRCFQAKEKNLMLYHD